MTETKFWEVEPFERFAAEPLPEAQWLIEPLFERDSQVVLWGESGTGKSFVALSWALHIATGTPWLGKFRVEKANVLMCVGEGARGARRRARAAAREYGFKSVEGLSFMTLAPRIRDPKVLEEFLKIVKDRMARFVIIDTLARALTGDENSNEVMNDWMNAATKIQRETGACVLVVHHTAKNVKKGGVASERGGGALRAAMDTSIQVRGGEHITLMCVKQKDDRHFDDIPLMLKQVELRPETEFKKALTSAVIVPHEESIPTATLVGEGPHEKALASLTEPMTIADWRESTVLEDEKTPAESTFYRWVKKLETEDLVEHDPETGKWGRK